MFFVRFCMWDLIQKYTVILNVVSGLPDSLGNNGDQYFNATFGGESTVPEFNPFSVSFLLINDRLKFLNWTVLIKGRNFSKKFQPVIVVYIFQRHSSASTCQLINYWNRTFKNLSWKHLIIIINLTCLIQQLFSVIFAFKFFIK